jgi:hypothetical protein
MCQAAYAFKGTGCPQPGSAVQASDMERVRMNRSIVKRRIELVRVDKIVAAVER